MRHLDKHECRPGEKVQVWHDKQMLAARERSVRGLFEGLMLLPKYYAASSGKQAVAAFLLL